MSASILHADVDAFFASVEQRDNPQLRGRPVAVGLGVVMAASYEAKAHGVRGGMGGAQARRLCPELVPVPPRFSAYLAASRSVFAVFERTAPQIEGLSMEEAFLDVSGLEEIAGSPHDIATRLRREVRAEAGLPITVGAASTRVVAKMASRAAKPDGLLVIPPGGERGFLHPLHVSEIWGVGPATADVLTGHGIATVADLAGLPEATLIAIVGGATGRRLHALAHLRETHRAWPRRGRRTFGSQAALGRGPHSSARLDAVINALVERVTRRMRAAGRAGRTIILRLRFGDYSRASRSHTLAQATASTAPALAAARSLLAGATPQIERRGLTLLGITIANLAGPGAGIQLELLHDRARADALDLALDELRDRFGPAAVTRGTPDPDLTPALRPGEGESAAGPVSRRG